MTNEAVKHEQQNKQLATMQSLPVNSMHDIVVMGEFIFQSGMMGATSPASGFSIAAICHQERMSFLEFGRRYHIDSHGKATMRSDRMQAEFIERGGTIKWITKANDKTRQSALFTKGVNVDYEIEFAYQEAVDAGYIKPGSNWEKDVCAQMRARVVSRGVRMIDPGAVSGTYTPQEMEDVYANDPAQEATPNFSRDDQVNLPDGALKEIMSEPETQPEQEQQQPSTTQVDIFVNNTQQQPSTPFEQPPNFDLCPMPGSVIGKAWKDFTTAHLQAAQNVTSPAMHKQHYEAIKTELNAREQK